MYLGDAIKNHEALKDLMGDNRMEQEKKLKERLDRRKKRKADGEITYSISSPYSQTIIITSENLIHLGSSCFLTFC